MANPDILFRGIPRGPTRGYTAQVLQALTKTPSRVVIPCTGSFSLASVAVQAGIPAERLFCGDVSLYSHALGMAIMGAEYRLELKDDYFAGLAPLAAGDAVDKACAVLFAIRVMQYRVRSHTAEHWRQREAELMINAEVYLEQIAAQVRALAGSLGGLEYRPQDLWVTLERFMNDPEAVLLVNPPRYTGGYDKMFEGVDQVFDWDAPSFRPFSEAEYAPLMAMLASQPALTLMYYATPDNDPAPLWGEPWRAVFADRPGQKRGVSINWIIANRTPAETMISRSVPPGRGARYALFGDEETIGAESGLNARRIDKVTGDYYRDLFIHRLEGGQAEVYVGLFLDGRLFGVAGINTKGIFVTKTKASDEQMTGLLTFCFTVEAQRYPRLQKLALMAVCSSWLWEEVFREHNWFQVLGCPSRLETSMQTNHPEVKTARGVLDLLRREKGEPPHRFKLVYGSGIIQRSAKETLEGWLAKYGGVR